jgi:hypothetical protein
VAVGAGVSERPAPFIRSLKMTMDGMGMMGMMIFMFLFGLLLIALFVLIVVAVVKWLWGSKMPFIVSDRENALKLAKNAMRKARSVKRSMKGSKEILNNS